MRESKTKQTPTNNNGKGESKEAKDWLSDAKADPFGGPIDEDIKLSGNYCQEGESKSHGMASGASSRRTSVF